MNLDAVAVEIADRLGTIPGLRSYAFPPDSIAPPAAMLPYPEDVTFDETYGRGADRLTMSVLVAVGEVSDRASRIELAAYCDGTGDRSLKQVLESGTYTAFHSLRVVGIEFLPVTIGDQEYAGADFELDVFGQGSS